MEGPASGESTPHVPPFEPQSEFRPSPEQQSKLPSAPEMKRRLRFHKTQLGIPLLLLIPLLALFNVFGEAEERLHAANGQIALDVEAPVRTRSSVNAELELRVRNVTPQPLRDVRVQIDADYLAAFSGISSMHTFVADHTIELGSIPPGAERRVSLNFKPESPGIHRGSVNVRARSTDEARVTWKTLIYP